MAETILEVSKLTKSFDGGSAVLNEINFSIKKGEVVVVVGPSGCGKSTFLRCLNFLEQIDSGEILLDGKKIDTSAKALPKYREKIGMVFQSYELFPHKTVLENVVLAPLLVQKRNKAEAKAEAEKLLQVVLELAKEGMTMLIVTHEMDFAKAVADRVIFLDQGEIIEEEPPEIFFGEPKTERAKRFLNTFHYEALEDK